MGIRDLFNKNIDTHYFGKIKFDNIGKCYIITYGEEGNKEPHFHIVNKWNKTLYEISLIRPKILYRSKRSKDLTKNDINKIIDNMNYASDYNPKPVKNWILMILMWNPSEGNNEYNNFPKDIPNYLKLMEELKA